MTQIGDAEASGTVGSANALTAGITGAGNSFTQALLLSKLLGTPAGGGNVVNTNGTGQLTIGPDGVVAPYIP